MIPEFLANGLASPTHSLALVALLTVANLANAELAHLRRLYMISAVEYATKNPEFLSQVDSPAQSLPVVLFPVRQSWQLHFVHGLGIFGSLLVSVVSLMAPSVRVGFHGFPFYRFIILEKLRCGGGVYSRHGNQETWAFT
ncbi:hypothetical protein AAHC03_013450 [Spirometra sp. Aus1]